MKRLGMILILLSSMWSAEAGMIRDFIQARQTHSGSSVNELKTLFNLSYGEDKKEKMDVYLPNNPHNAPIIVMVHGGAWSKGDKKSDNVVENKMNRWREKGAIFVSVNYRLVPKVNTLEQVKDIARALAYIQNHAVSWGGNPEQIVLMGHSAGAHLVSLLSAAPEKAYALGVKPWLGTVSLDTATMDLVETMNRRHYPFYDDVFGENRDYWEQNSPLYQLERSAPPMLLVCSTLRDDKPCEHSISFMEKGRGLGIRMEMSEQPLTHAQINDDLGKNGSYTDRVESFMKSLGLSL